MPRDGGRSEEGPAGARHALAAAPVVREAEEARTQSRSARRTQEQERPRWDQPRTSAARPVAFSPMHGARRADSDAVIEPGWWCRDAGGCATRRAACSRLQAAWRCWC